MNDQNNLKKITGCIKITAIVAVCGVCLIYIPAGKFVLHNLMRSVLLMLFPDEVVLLQHIVLYKHFRKLVIYGLPKLSKE